MGSVVARLNAPKEKEARCEIMGPVRVEHWPHFNNVGIPALPETPDLALSTRCQPEVQSFAHKCTIRGIRGCHHRMRDLETDFALVCVTNGVLR
jgi:hypothetical protein